MILMPLVAAMLLAQGVPPGAEPVSGEIPLAAVAGAARYRFSASQGDLLDGLDPRSRATLAGALQLDSDASAGPLWSHLMAGALQVRREAAGSADTLWFNPVLDAGLLVRWLREGDGWVAIAAAPVRGERLRGDAISAGNGTAGSAAPAWAARGGNLSAALDAEAERSFAAAEAGSWNRLFAAGAEDELATLARPLLARRSLRELEATAGYEQSLRLLHRLLVTEDPAERRLPEAMQQSLAAFGETARLTLRPVTALRRTDGWTVVMQSPDKPAVAWFAHFRDPDAGAPALPAAFATVSLNLDLAIQP